MTLATSAAATFDRSQYTVQIVGVEADLALLPGVNRARVTIAAGVEVDASPGADATVALDGGDGEATVITGAVAAVQRSTDGTVVTVTDAGSELARSRPFETYEGLLATQVIMRLADAVSVDTGPVVATLPTAAYVADPSRTIAEHVCGLAAQVRVPRTRRLRRPPGRDAVAGRNPDGRDARGPRVRGAQRALCRGAARGVTGRRRRLGCGPVP